MSPPIAWTGWRARIAVTVVAVAAAGVWFTRPGPAADTPPPAPPAPTGPQTTSDPTPGGNPAAVEHLLPVTGTDRAQLVTRTRSILTDTSAEEGDGSNRPESARACASVPISGAWTRLDRTQSVLHVACGTVGFDVAWTNARVWNLTRITAADADAPAPAAVEPGEPAAWPVSAQTLAEAAVTAEHVIDGVAAPGDADTRNRALAAYTTRPLIYNVRQSAAKPAGDGTGQVTRWRTVTASTLTAEAFGYGTDWVVSLTGTAGGWKVSAITHTLCERAGMCELLDPTRPGNGG